MEPQNGKNNRSQKEKSKRLYRLASKKASEESRENPKNAQGPEWHPEETPEQKGRTARTGEQTNAAGTEKKKKKQQHVRGGVWCPVSPELYLFREKGERRETTNDIVSPDPKTERTRQKTRPDMKNFFLKHFRGEIARKYAKTIGKSTPKTQGPKKRAKTKVRSRKLIAQTDPEKKRTLPKKAKDKNQTTKNTNEKKRAAFPPSSVGKSTNHLRDSTVRQSCKSICLTVRLLPHFLFRPLFSRAAGESGGSMGSSGRTVRDTAPCSFP